MTDYFVEHRPNLKRHGPPVFVPKEDLEQYTGFRGVYAFDIGSVMTIHERGHMRDLGEISAYSEQLLLDFDNNPDAAAKFKSYLLGHNTSFTEYDSGNRSVHFHVEIKAMLGDNVPALQKYWVSQHAPEADTSFYHKCGIYRLPGTYHLKNPGHSKREVSIHKGKLLKIAVSKSVVQRIASQSKGEGTCGTFQWLITQSVLEGNRTPHMFRIVKTGQDLGYSFEDTIEELLHWNENHSNPPHEPEYIQKWATRVWR